MNAERTRAYRDRRAPAKDLADALREPYLVLDEDLRVRSASHGFCERFQVSREEAEGHHLYTDSRAALAALRASEMRYRRLFETAQDGILILDAASGKIVDANPFIKALLGYSHDELLGKELWEIGLFGDIAASQAAFRELRETGYIRYEHLPLETRGGRKVEVEFVSNVYRADASDVIQCNIRDITARSGLEREAREQSVALAELHRRKDEFLAMLSHELRNPLSSIVNALQWGSRRRCCRACSTSSPRPNAPWITPQGGWVSD